MSSTNLSSFIWSVADLLRGDYKQSEYGKVILPFTVLRRLDCVLESTKSETLKQQAANNTKEQFANSPDLKTELMNAIIGALDAHTAMSSQALESETIRDGLKDVLLGPAQLYEALRK
jgi:type I restriction enzyme R subunit